tara:strand:- start:1805 stop:2071 length:267 start_codon:yes stop_codon:yes gene_type:complete
MVDYKISINNGSFEQNFEFRYDEHNFQWQLYSNGLKMPYSIKIMEDNDSTSYDLCKNDEPIKGFEFEVGALGNIPNLLEVLMYILKVS